MNNNFKFQALESLRAYLAWWVVIGHALQLSGFGTFAHVNEYLTLTGVDFMVFMKLHQVLLNGGSAVKVFIILSGFVITHLLLTKNEPYINFITRRFFRLAPALYVCLILSICLLDFYKIAYTGLGFSDDTLMRQSRIFEQENHFYLHLFNHLTLIHSFFPQELIPFSPTTFLGPAWSIGLEWQFYLIAPLLLFYLKRSQSAILTVAISFLIIRYIIQHVSGLHWQYDSFFFNVPDYFLVGIFSRLIIDRLSNNKKIVGITILCGALMFIQDSYSTYVWLFMLGVIFYEIGRFKFESAIIKKLLNFLFFNNVITSIGRWSYSTYLVHIPVFTLMLGGYVSYTENYGIDRIEALYIIGLSMPLILIISSLMYKYVELPAMSFISSKLKARSNRPHTDFWLKSDKDTLYK